MQQINRRTLFKVGIGMLSLSATTVGALTALTPRRFEHSMPTSLPGIQFDIAAYLAPARIVDENGIDAVVGMLVGFGPVYTLFLPARLLHQPVISDQQILTDALHTIESTYPFSPRGIFPFVSYGLPYFRRLPQQIVSQQMPRLLSDRTRFALEEAVPGPTDISHLNPDIIKRTYNVPVQIEANDVLFTLRSDELSHIQDVANWLQGRSSTLHGKRIHGSRLENIFTFAPGRLQFQQPGLPRKVADAHRLSYAGRINPYSSMWMGFSDQQVNANGPATICSFQGNNSARFTTTKTDDYFYDGAIQHFSHILLDLQQFYGDDQPFMERCQQMFRSNPLPSSGYTDQFVDGGGPTYLENIFQGQVDAEANAQGLATFGGERRIGHLSALHRSSRTADGTPMHIRMDGPGFDALDIPDGSLHPKLHFTMFVPTADMFATMRAHQASVDLAQKYKVLNAKNGLERFLTTTRRQNFLIPPRVHRAFPLVELYS